MSSTGARTTRRADLGVGVLPSQFLKSARREGWIHAGKYVLPDRNIQPASVDLRLGEVAYRLRCSFLPDDVTSVETRLATFAIETIDLASNPVLDVDRPYLIPLMEELRLPPDVRGKANPKSSTGRLDVFTRVITDGNYRFDEIPAGYTGRMYLEVLPRSFPIKVRPELSLNQLRLLSGAARCSDAQIRAQHDETPLLYSDTVPVGAGDLRTADGLFLRVGLSPRGESKAVGYQARRDRNVLDLSSESRYEWDEFWAPVTLERDSQHMILHPETFYLLLSDERVSIPPTMAAEMAAYDPTAGELRTHYAGFFDPGFGYSRDGDRKGSAAVLEVRAHDVPFMVEHRQRICKLTFERMADIPEVLYGEDVGSNYQDQDLTGSKHFRSHGSRRMPQLSLVRGAGEVNAAG